MTERPTYPKSTCAVPGCTSWSRRYPTEWLCGRHWRTVRRPVRLALRKSWRLWPDNPPPVVVKRELRLWGHAVRQATLKAAGL